MNRISPMLFFVAFSFGCGISEEKFVEQYAEAYCEWLDGCGKLSEQFGTMDTCVTNRKIFADENLTPDSCGYDKVSAKQCVKEVEENESCDITEPLPESCEEVAGCNSDTGR